MNNRDKDKAWPRLVVKHKDGQGLSVIEGVGYNNPTLTFRVGGFQAIKDALYARKLGYLEERS